MLKMINFKERKIIDMNVSVELNRFQRMFLMKGTRIVFHDRKLHVFLFLQHTLLHRHYLFSLSSNISQEYCCNRCFGYWCGFAYALKFHWLASSGRIPGNSGWLLGWHCSSMLRTKFQRVTNRLKIIFNNSQIWLIFFLQLKFQKFLWTAFIYQVFLYILL